MLKRYILLSIILLAGFISNKTQAQSMTINGTVTTFPTTLTNVSSTPANGGQSSFGVQGGCFANCCSTLVYKVTLPTNGVLRMEMTNFTPLAGSIIAYRPLVANPTSFSDLTHITQTAGNFCGFRDTLELGRGFIEWNITPYGQLPPPQPNSLINTVYDFNNPSVNAAYFPAGDYYIIFWNHNTQVNLGGGLSDLTFEFAPQCPIGYKCASLSVEICDALTYTSPSGKLLTSSGSYEDTLIGLAAGGLDSLIYLNLTFNYGSLSQSVIPDTAICINYTDTLETNYVSTLKFDKADDDWVEINEVAPSLASSNRSVFTWIKKSTQVSGSSQMLVAFNTSSNGNVCNLQIGTNEQLQVFDGSNAQNSGVVVTDGVWHHVGYTYDETTDSTFIYVDGMVVDKYKNSQTVSASNKVSIGQEFDSGNSKGNFYDGEMTEISIWNEVLSPAEINLIKNATIESNHPKYTNLVAYYTGITSCNGVSLDTLVDMSPNGFHGVNSLMDIIQTDSLQVLPGFNASAHFNFSLERNGSTVASSNPFSLSVVNGGNHIAKWTRDYFQVSDTFNIACGPLLMTSINVDNPASCSGATDAALTASASNGTAPFTYQWSNGATTASINGLTNASYTVTVSDAVGGVGTSTVTIPVIDTIKPIITTRNITVYLDTSGQVSISEDSVIVSITDNCGVQQNTSGSNKISATIFNEGFTTNLTPAGWAQTSVSIGDIWSFNGGLDFGSTAVLPDAIGNLGQYARIDMSLDPDTTALITPAISLANVSNPEFSFYYISQTTAPNFSPFNRLIVDYWNGSNWVNITVIDSLTTSGWVQYKYDAVPYIYNTDSVKFRFAGQEGGLAVGGTGTATFNQDLGLDEVSITGLVPAPAPANVTTYTCSDIGQNTITISASDVNGNVDSATAIVTVLDTNQMSSCFSLSITSSNVSCNGGIDGTATSSITGGTAPYTYLWSNGATTANLNGLAVGIYNLTLTDNAGLTATDSASITEPSALVAATLVDSNVTCNAFIDGGATASASGGTSPYTYSWSNSATTASITGVAAGTYTATITDNNGCTATSSSTITEPVALMATVALDSNDTGNGGGATASATGGTTPYTYLWSNAATSASIIGVSTGTYTVTLTDNNGCTDSDQLAVTAGPTVTVQVDSNVSCNGFTDGGATASTTGGTMPYTYLWSNGATSASINGLTNATYTVTVSDASGNTVSAAVTIQVVDTIKPSVLTQGVTVYLDAVGTASISTSDVDNGTTDNCGVSTLSLDVSSFACADVGANTVYLIATDVNGNVDSAMATVTVVDSIKPIITTQNITVYLDTSGQVSISEDSVVVSITDNCGVQDTPGGNMSATIFNEGFTSNLMPAGWAQTSVSPTDRWTFTGGLDFGATAVLPDANGTSGQYARLDMSIDPDTTALITPAISLANVSNPEFSFYYISQTTAPNFSPFNRLIVDYWNGSNWVNITVIDSLTTSGWVQYKYDATPFIYSTDSVKFRFAGQEGGAAIGGTGTATFNQDIGIDEVTITGLVSAPAPTNVITYTCSDIGQNTLTISANDVNGNVDSATAIVSVLDTNQVSACFSVSISSSNVSCNGGVDGTATSSITGGTAPYTYLWSNGATTANLNGLATGTYNLTLTDNFGLTATSTTSITEPSALVAATLVDSNVTCNRIADGGATGSASGGTSPYTYSWSNSATTASITGVTAGTYTVTLTDNNGCTATSSSTITEPVALMAAVALDSNDAGNGGGATASATGGTMPYTYLWSNAATSASITGVAAGTYTVTLTDNNGCTDSDQLTITAGPVISMQVDSNVSCNGLSDGGARVNASAGNPPYTYLWSNSATTASITGLAAGTYTITVTDNIGLSEVDSVAITEPLSLVASSAVDSNVSCNAFTDGGATASASGGTMPYTYLWSNSAISASITGVAAGTYTATITDNNGCTAMTSAIITEPAALAAASAVDSNITCNGLNDGGATASATGGTMPYTYLWSNASTTASITGVAAGTYTATVTDNNGCTSTTSSTLTEPALLVAASTVDSNITCNGLSDGGITASAMGGTSPYTYAWSNAATTASITGVAAGSYTVTITDNNGCTSTTSSTVTEPALLVVASAVDSNITCNGLSDGGITASAMGGTSPYTYAWSNAATTASITGVAAGSYTATITDNNGCTSTMSSTVTEPVLLVAASTVDSNITCNGLSDGGITASAMGGTSPYTYAWSNSATTASITGVVAGTYTVTITDNNACTSVSSATIIEPVVLVVASVIDSNATCLNFSDGGATASASGGTMPYTYLWSNAATTASITGIANGTYTVTITDNNGCTGTVSSTIMVVDTIKPTVLTQSVTVYLDAAGIASITAADVDNGTTDSCGAPTLSLDVSTFSCADIGANTVYLIASDVNGNVDSAMATVTVVDSIKPSLLTQAVTVYLDASGTASISPADVDNGTTDNCGIPSLSLDVSSFTCADVGANTVYLIASDLNGNIDSAMATVTVVDSIKPSVLTQAVTVYLDAVGMASISPADVDNGTTDNCGTPSLSLDVSSFACADVSANTVHLIATDMNGNIDSSTVVISVLDTIKPLINNCVSPISQVVDAGTCAAVVTWSAPTAGDNCGVDSLISNFNSGDIFPIGTTEVIYIAYDQSMNTDTCRFSVTITDNEDPVIANVPANITVNNDFGNCAAVVNWTAATASDNCTLDSLRSNFNSGDEFPVGTTTVTYTAYDAAMNTSTASFTITVNDTELPTITCPSDIAQCDSIVSFSDATALDNCSIASLVRTDASGLNSGDQFPVGTTTLSYQVTDIHNNQASCSFDVQVYAPALANAGPDLETRDIEPIQIQASSTNATLFNWTPFMSLDDATVERPIANPQVTTIYRMDVTSPDGCTDSDEMQITVTVVDELEATTLFSPNGDGMNDTWVVNKPELVRGCQLIIVNRNGTEVYSTNQYNNEWDGTINGEQLPEGTYYYVFDCSDGRTLNGPITILRERR